MIKRRRPNFGQYSAINYVMVKALPWGAHEDSFFAGANPAVANGDYATVPALTAPDNFVFTLTSTGVPVIQSNGSTARQTILLDVYDTSLRKWMGRVTDYVNDAAPVMLDSAHHTFAYPVGVPIIDLDLRTFVIDPNGDQVTITTSDPLPPGLTIAANVLTGTPAQLGSFTVTFRADDGLGPFTLFPSYSFGVNPNTVDQGFSLVAFAPSKIPLDVYTNAPALTLQGLWTGDSVAIDGSGAVTGAPGAGGKFVWLGDGGIYLSKPSPNAALLAWGPIFGAQSYNVYQNGMLLVNIVDLQYTAVGLQVDTTYLFNVTAVMPGSDGGTLEFQNGSAIMRFSSPDPTVTLMPRKIPFPSVGWN